MTMKRVLLLAVFLLTSFALAQTTVPESFWAIEFNHPNSAYPAPVNPHPTFHTLRLSDTNTGWGDIEGNNQIHGCNPSNKIDFTYLDKFLNHYTAGNDFDVIYTMAKTPCFISVFPTDASCKHWTGSCDPPKDIKCNGTGVAATGGTDAALINFLKVLWPHIMAQPYYQGRHWYFEVWNEPNVGFFWNNGWINDTYCGGDHTATRRIMMRMAADSRRTVAAIDPTVQFITPSVSVALTETRKYGWWWDYLGGETQKFGGGGKVADIMGVHSYIGTYPVESVCCGKGTLIANTLATMAEFGQSGKPLWITEGSCGAYCPVVGDNVAWIGAYYTLILSQGQAVRYVYNSYDNFAPLWNGTQLTPMGLAVAVMEKDWGYETATFAAGGCTSTVQTSCAGQGKIWTCNLTEGGSGTVAQTAWYDSKNNTCSYTPGGSGWVDYNDLTGNKTDYTGGPVTLTNRPILFEK
jgi:hypothetical protein